MSRRPKTNKPNSEEIIELLNELRVALPGVQVLFAFLLAVPFTPGWADVTGGEIAAYFISFLATTVASVLLIAPTAHHRLQWRENHEEWLLRTSNVLTVVGTAFLAVAITAAVYFVTNWLFGGGVAAGVTVGTSLLFAVIWYALPLSRRR